MGDHTSMPTSTSPGDRDPYAAPRADEDVRPHPGGPPAPRPPADQGSGDRPPVSTEHRQATREVRRTLLIGAAAMLMAVLLPPLGVVLAVLTLVRAARGRAAVDRSGLGTSAIVLPVTSGLLALMVGVAMTMALLVFRSDLGAYQECSSGANTNQAQRICQETLTDALRARLGG